jgi:hypothetical protein
VENVDKTARTYSRFGRRTLHWKRWAANRWLPPLVGLGMLFTVLSWYLYKDVAASVFYLNSDSMLYVYSMVGVLFGVYFDRLRNDTSIEFSIIAYIVLPLFLYFVVPYTLSNLTDWAPRSIDRYLAKIDDQFNSPAFVFSTYLYGHKWRWLIESIWYGSLIAMMPINIATAKYPSVSLLMIIVYGSIAAALYYIFPTLGPGQAIVNFPYDGEVWNPIPKGVCNGFPSFHTATVMGFILCSTKKGLPFWIIYAFGMIVCCIASGQHWLVDCIAGAFLAWIVFSACNFINNMIPVNLNYLSMRKIRYP